jgi:hypothetical protein
MKHIINSIENIRRFRMYNKVMKMRRATNIKSAVYKKISYIIL